MDGSEGSLNLSFLNALSETANCFYVLDTHTLHILGPSRIYLPVLLYCLKGTGVPHAIISRDNVIVRVEENGGERRVTAEESDNEYRSI